MHFCYRLQESFEGQLYHVVTQIKQLVKTISKMRECCFVLFCFLNVVLFNFYPPLGRLH